MQPIRKNVYNYQVITFTYRDLPIELLGKIVFGEDDLRAKKKELAKVVKSKELFYLSTCNRILLLFFSEVKIDKQKLQDIIKVLSEHLSYEETVLLAERAKIFKEEKAVEHCLYVASSLDSMVVGEKEILGQFKRAFDKAVEEKIAGENVSLLCKKAIKAAKEVFNQTKITQNPVSVVSLAYRKWENIVNPQDAKIVIVGAGKTVQNFCHYLPESFNNKLTFFNRNIDNAKKVADKFDADFLCLEDLPKQTLDFNTLLVCTGSTTEIITPEVFSKISGNSSEKKIIIDLAVPQDVSSEVANLDFVEYIDIVSLQSLANRNLKEREKELPNAYKIIKDNIIEFCKEWKDRQLEIAFSPIPQQVKAIKEKALGDVFFNKVDQLDKNSREVLNEIVEYMEKKYIAIPIKTAKKVFSEVAFPTKKEDL